MGGTTAPTGGQRAGGGGEGSELPSTARRRTQTGGGGLWDEKVWPGGHPGLPLLENQPLEPALLLTSKTVSSRLLWARKTPRRVFNHRAGLPGGLRQSHGPGLLGPACPTGPLMSRQLRAQVLRVQRSPWVALATSASEHCQPGYGACRKFLGPQALAVWAVGMPGRLRVLLPASTPAAGGCCFCANLQQPFLRA